MCLSTEWLNRPPSHYWLVTFSSQPECINETVHVIFAGSLNTLSDLFVALFPIPQILKLQIPRRQRLIVIFLFAAGLLVCVAGAVRTYYTYVELTSTDETWDNYYVWISSSVELYIGIVCTSFQYLLAQRHQENNLNKISDWRLYSRHKAIFQALYTLLYWPDSHFQSQ